MHKRLVPELKKELVITKKAQKAIKKGMKKK